MSLGTRTEITVEAAAYFLGVTLKADTGFRGIIVITNYNCSFHVRPCQEKKGENCFVIYKK